MKGRPMNPWLIWFLVVISFSLFGHYLVYRWSKELRGYLGREDINPTFNILLSGCCAPLVFWSLGPLVQEAQQRCGMSDAQDRAWLFVLATIFGLGFGFFLVQRELNRVWDTPAGAPAVF